MQIKKDLLSHMEANHPDFKFAWAKSVFYNFRRVHEDGLYDCIFFQRDGRTGALAVEVATTYDPLWDGAQTFRLGYNTGLANLKFEKPNAIEVELNWYIYDNSRSQLNIVLAEISGDIQIHAFNFFAESAQKLRSDKLLQHGLELARKLRPLNETDRLQLAADLKATWYMGQKMQNPFYNKLNADLHKFAEETGISIEHMDKWYSIHLLAVLQEPMQA